jgi:large subunit ribosomal protein L25
MGIIPLQVKKRETGKKAAKILRNQKFVPGIFYMKGEEPVAIYSDPLSLRPIVYTHSTKIIALEIEGEAKKHEAVVKDVTFDPVTDSITHFDLMGIEQGKEMTIEVPIVLKGQSPGVRLGGLLQHIVRKVNVTCLPKDLPESIDIDISNLGIGHSATLSQANVVNIEFDLPKESVVCSVIPPRVGGDTQDAKG